jgi:hypothetical protein
MVNIECQSNSFHFDNHQSFYLPKMSSSTNLYNYLTNNIPTESYLNTYDDDSDNGLSIETIPIRITSSTSSDSAIVSDDIDDLDSMYEKQTKYRQSWPLMIENNETITSLSQSSDILNQQTIYDNNTSNSKYKHPLPWSTVKHNYISLNKV